MQPTTTTHHTPLLALLLRVKRLASAAAAKGVRLMIDAEHSYFQPAIDHTAARLMHRFNAINRKSSAGSSGAGAATAGVRRPVIFTTYQCYLRDSRRRLADDMERAGRQGYVFACKLVRGAYMHQERQRAEQLGYESPVCDR